MLRCIKSWSTWCLTLLLQVLTYLVFDVAAPGPVHWYCNDQLFLMLVVLMVLSFFRVFRADFRWPRALFEWISYLSIWCMLRYYMVRIGWIFCMSEFYGVFQFIFDLALKGNGWGLLKLVKPYWRFHAPVHTVRCWSFLMCLLLLYYFLVWFRGTVIVLAGYRRFCYLCCRDLSKLTNRCAHTCRRSIVDLWKYSLFCIKFLRRCICYAFCT